MTTGLKWEKVEDGIARTRTPTGWLVREVSEVCNDLSENGLGRLETGYEWRTTLTFVPDPDGIWLFENKIETPT